ncbi:MAG: dynein heavy chain, partial [Mycoplasma sp.]
MNNIKCLQILKKLYKEDELKDIPIEENWKIFFNNDTSYTEEIAKLKKAFKIFSAPGEVMLRCLNTEIKPHWTDWMKFASSKNLDEESWNITVFRHYINENKKFFNFFTRMFKYDHFFLGGINIKVKAAKEIWLRRWGDTKTNLFKLVMSNNVSWSTQMEKEKIEIQRQLEEEPKNAYDYEKLILYCRDWDITMKSIWDKINTQQENGEWLEENFNQIKTEDFFRMWSCYGIPRFWYVKREDTIARLEDKRKILKKEVKQNYKDIVIEISQLRQEFETKTVINEIDNYEDTFWFFSSMFYQINDKITACKTLNNKQSILKMKISDLSEITTIKLNFDPYYSWWDSVQSFENEKKKWMEGTWKQIDRKTLKSIYEKCVNTIENWERNHFRREKPAPYRVIQLLKQKIKEFEPILPVLYDLINPDFKANHIGDLSRAIGITIPDNLDITMTEWIKKGILTKRDEISDRSTYATGQKKWNATLEKMKEKYKQMKFDTMFFKNTDWVILKDVEPLMEDIDAVLTKIVSMSNSKYAKYLQKDIHFIWSNISKAQEIIDEWLKAQKLLTQLQQIFVYGDWKKQLSEEYPKYQTVEKQWRQIMEQVRGSPQWSEIVQMTKIKESFMKWSSVWEDVNKSLNDYLNMKRDIFPRFYFVSNEEWTWMWAQSGDPALIATNFIQQVFEGMKKWKYSTQDYSFEVLDYETNEKVTKVYHTKKFLEFV